MATTAAPETQAAATEPIGPSRRGVAAAFAALGGGALAGLAGVLGMLALFVHLTWTNQEPLGNPVFGINYSCQQAEYLLLEDPILGRAGYVSDDRPDRNQWCADNMLALVDGLGVRDVRISVPWSEVEPLDGVYDFALLDALLAAAETRDVRVLVGVGIKSQRHPEYYFPGWLLERVTLPDGTSVDDDPLVRERAMRMVAAVVSHAAPSPAVDAWGAENEPYLWSHRSHRWTMSREFVQAEVATIRANDPRGRPVAINHGQHYTMDHRWRQAIEDGDAYGASMYPFRNVEILGQTRIIDILQMGWLTPNYPHHAREAEAAGKRFWITELQGEPWTDDDLRLISPANPSGNLTGERFEKAIEYARRSGASRVYFWGAEWWFLQRERFGDSSWWEIARAAVATGPQTPPE